MYKRQAEDYLAQHLDEIERVAQQKVYDLGYDYPVQAQMVRMWFPTKSYESVTLPAGEYDALRITIGSAQGKNWWCVLYPPLCIPAAQEDKQLDDVLNEEQLEIVQSNPKYEVRFQLLEWWDQLLQLFQA